MPIGAGGPGSVDLVCRITAVSASGASMERDAIARYIDSRCCSGYEFVSQNITITFQRKAAGLEACDEVNDGARSPPEVIPLSEAALRITT
jgi:hypothetical protein